MTVDEAKAAAWKLFQHANYRNGKRWISFSFGPFPVVAGGRDRGTVMFDSGSSPSWLYQPHGGSLPEVRVRWTH